MNGTQIHHSSSRIWHGTMDFAAWHEEGGAFYPRICCRPIGTSATRFADDMQTSPSLHEAFKQLLLQPQQARFMPQSGNILLHLAADYCQYIADRAHEPKSAPGSWPVCCPVYKLSGASLSAGLEQLVL